MASSGPTLAALLKRADIEDHEEVLHAAESTLKQAKGDINAQHVKAVALLKLDRYNDALRVLEDGGAQLQEKARLEYAYALYKSGQPAKAVEVARGETERGLQHVEAQASYRTEDFKTAAQLYRQLSSKVGDDAAADLRINAGAVDAQLEWSGHGDFVQRKKPERKDLEAFETAYNAACGSIARGELAQGEVLLKRARDLCNAVEDMSEEDKQAELLPIAVQQIYVLVRLGRHNEADSLAKNIDIQNIPDISSKLIAQANEIAATETPTNPFLAQRLLTRNLDSLGPDHPFLFQTSILKGNQHALNLQSLKNEGVMASTAKAISQRPSPNVDSFCNSLSVVNAAAHAKSTTGKEALKHMLPLLDRRPNDIGLILTIVQLYVLMGNLASGTSLLETVLARLEQSGNATELNVRFAPGIVGVITSLYESQSRRSHLEREMAKAASHWQSHPESRPHSVTNLLKAAGTILIESEDEAHNRQAQKIFGDLHSQDPEDRYASAGLVAASPSSASTEQIASLTPIDKLISGIDTDALENGGIAKPASSEHAAVTQRKRPAEDTKAKKAKKIRKSRLPKDYDPNKKPDPERWLPLRDRSTYRPKGRKGKARANLLSQGAAPAGESDGSQPGAPGREVVKQKQQSGGGGGKKKKGKSKW